MGLFNRTPPAIPTHSRPGFKPPLPPRPQPQVDGTSGPEPVLAGYYANWTVYAKPPFPPSSAAYYHLNTILSVIDRANLTCQII
ncbi:hypothetical protein DFH28DRAFT_16355 [Melampsora americana]|nr:hypothetical protein DFH28DRAFT_16355 [Melampsora americana]